jgi:hypothetical protein
MRYRTILTLALILGLVPALNTAPLLAMQAEQQPQRCDPDRIVTVGEETFEFKLDCTNDFLEGLEVTAGPADRSAEAGGSGEAERLYAVRFIGEAGTSEAVNGEAGTPESGNEVGAYIPERFNSQAMVVKVLAGRFAFRVQGPNVIVDPQGQPLERVKASTPIGLGANPNVGTPRTYAEDGSFDCGLELHGHTLCQLDPAEFKTGEKFVRLDPGDTVFLPDKSTCFLCNTDRINPTTGEIVESGGVPAELLIWTPTTGFDEIGGALENAANAMASVPQGTPTTQGSGRIVGWMFNPSTNCRR